MLVDVNPLRGIFEFTIDILQMQNRYAVKFFYEENCLETLQPFIRSLGCKF
jgi:hypothetical protein